MEQSEPLPEQSERLPEPTHRLAPEARSIWRLTGALWCFGLAVAAIAASGPLSDWDGRPGFVMPLLWTLVLVAGVVRIGVEPEIRWRRWRYEIRPEEIDIQRGVWTIKRTLVPMVRVQHVDTESGLLQQNFDLATVSFHTAAGPIEIPQLRRGDAQKVRDRIAELSRAAGGDV
jgi:membrane protein YdbS with pleckstrin-like domain